MPGDHEIDRNLNCKVFRKKIPVGESGFAKLVKMLVICFWALIYVPKFNITTLHCGQVLSTGLAGLVCRAVFKTRYIVFVCGSESIRFGRLPVLRKLMKKILQHADKIIANSEHTKQEYVQSGIGQERIAVFTPGVDTDVFKATPGTNFFREKYQLGSDPVLLTVSRLDERKGHDMVLQVLPHILVKFPTVKYLIAGTGREEGRLKSLVQQLDLKNHVIFAGYIDENKLPALYNAGDIFILPNRKTTNHTQLRGDIEGFGIVFLEAAACGKPTIAGNNGGATEAVKNGVSGLLVNPEKTNEINEALLQLLEDSTLAKTLGRNGRTRCTEIFQWSKLANKLETEIL